MQAVSLHTDACVVQVFTGVRGPEVACGIFREDAVHISGRSAIQSAKNKKAFFITKRANYY